MELNNASRWALVTFAGCISNGIVGHYLPDASASSFVPILSLAFAFVGFAVISEK